MASCDIPAQVWVLFSVAPNLQGLFWTPHRSPGPPYPVSLYLHLTNCPLSHNTLSAFNYCLEVSGLRVTHSIGSLWVRVCSVRVCDWVARLNVQRVLCMTLGVLKEALNSTALFPLSHHVWHTLDLQLHQRLGPVLGVQMVRKEPPESTGNASDLWLQVSNLSMRANSEIILDKI